MGEKRTVATARKNRQSAERGRIAGLILSRAESLDFQSVLDVGCGRGELLELFLEEFPGIRACGIDLSERKLSGGEQKREKELTVGDAENLPYPDGSFDLLICGNSIRRCPNPARAINQFYRVLKKGGSLILFGYGRPSAAKLLAKAVSRYAKENGSRHSPKEVRGFLERSAFQKITWEVPYKDVYLAHGIK